MLSMRSDDERVLFDLSMLRKPVVYNDCKNQESSSMRRRLSCCLFAPSYLQSFGKNNRATPRRRVQRAQARELWRVQHHFPCIQDSTDQHP